MDRYYKNKQRKLDELFDGAVQINCEKDCIRMTGHCETWNDAVKACMLVAKSGSKLHVVNDIEVNLSEEEKQAPLGVLPDIKNKELDGDTPDVLIIGGGVIGCAIAREMSKNNLDILLVEKEYDVAIHASSRNDGMVHPGIDIKSGLLKRRLNNMGNVLFEKLTKELEVPFERVGQYLCFPKKSMIPVLIAAPFYFNKVVAGKAKFVGANELHEKEPGLAEQAKGGLFFDGAGIVCPFNLTIALAENAVENGVKISLDTAVISMKCTLDRVTGKNKIICVNTNKGKIYPKIIINAAGVFTEEIAKMAGDRFFSIHPRKGNNAILDKKAKQNVNTIYSLAGTIDQGQHSKGGGIVSTVHGNVLVGPSAEETPLKEDFTTERRMIDKIMSNQQNAGQWLSQRQIIAYFSGIRAATYEEDFIVERGRATSNIIHAAGIQSPGLTAAPAIGLEIEDLAKEMLGEEMIVEPNERFNPKRKAIAHINQMEPQERHRRIEENPDYGKIICRCEEISKGEVLDALRRPVRCMSLDGIKRRVRPTSGRCQGGFCGPLVLKVIADELGISPEDVRKGYSGSNVLIGEKGYGHEE